MILKLQKIILLKGEKIITVRASKRAKAHKRKVKSHKSEKVKFNDTNLRLFEDNIKKQDFESCAAFDANGEIIFSKDGEKDRVAFDDEERIMCNGTVFCHNHPIGHSGFSPADIRWACQSEMKEMRVISKSGERFTMVMKDGSNFNMKLWDEKINGIQRDMNNWVHEDFSEKINSKILTIQEATDAHWDTVWRKVVQRVPELRYDWVI